MTKLFVYGTLKRGYCRDHYLSDAEFLGEVHTAPKYQLKHLGSYPGMVHATKDGLAIFGELWDVPPELMNILDVVEAVDQGLYARAEIELDPPQANVISYLYLRPCADAPNCGPRWL